jgi:hypothetical protein
MSTEDIRQCDFWAALGEEFSQAVCPPVAFEDASPHECCEPLRQVLGPIATPKGLAALSESDLHGLASAFGAHFETPPPSLEPLRRAVEGVLARWPVQEWREEP